MANSQTRRFLHRELERSVGNLLWARLHQARCLEIFIDQILAEANLTTEQILALPVSNEPIELENEQVSDTDRPSKEQSDRAQELIQMANELEIPDRYKPYVEAISLSIQAIDMLLSTILSTKSVL